MNKNVDIGSVVGYLS